MGASDKMRLPAARGVVLDPPPTSPPGPDVVAYWVGEPDNQYKIAELFAIALQWRLVDATVLHGLERSLSELAQNIPGAEHNVAQMLVQALVQMKLTHITMIKHDQVGPAGAPIVDGTARQPALAPADRLSLNSGPVTCSKCGAGAPALQTREIEGKQRAVCPFCILRLGLVR